MQQFTEHVKEHYDGHETTLNTPSPSTTTPPNHLPTIEILNAAQRPDNPKTLKQTIRTDKSSSEFNS